MRIETRIAERIKKINPSSTLVITSQAKKLKSEGKDIVNFAAGEPDFDTPEFIKDACRKALDLGFTKYTPSSGIPELKELIAKKFKKDNGLDYSPKQIIVSCGAKHSIFNALMVLLNPQDEVLIPSPYWVSYPQMVHLCQGKVRFIKTSAQNNFKLDPQELKKYITPKTKLLILNSPANPTGCVYTHDELKEIAKICVEKKLFVLSDEIYEKLIYDGVKHISIASLGKDIYNLTLTVNGVSKSYAMTGWRIGYLGAPQDLAEAIAKVQDHTTSNPTSIAQKAAVAALAMSDDFSKRICQEFQKRRDYMVLRLRELKELSFVLPQGAFYIFCNIAKTGLDSSTFAQRLLNEAFVALIPGDGFGRDDYVRLSFATGIEEIEKGMNRIKDWLNKL
ncbi:MAG: pyridoxal phosphate-dependent aminotransferase [Candidatus Omnitrophica bacterium]|nr:pyridoxal phosphate-dependent aminotransferase [Candidatus Omnitrophota bacterium]